MSRRTRRELPREVDCRRTSARLDELLEHAFEYARRKRLVDRPFQAYRELSPVWEDYPEGWEGNVLGMLACGALFGFPKRAAAFCRAGEKRVPDAQLALARSWRRLPWCYAVFTVTADWGDRFLEIAPLGEPPAAWPADEPWDSLLLYSKGVTDDYRHGVRLFLAQLWAGPEAFQTYGVIVPFHSFTEEDLLYFADVCSRQHLEPEEEPLAGIAGRTRALSDLIGEHPLQFLRLFGWSQAPRTQSRTGELLRCAGCVTMPGEAISWDEAEWRRRIEAAGGRLSRMVIDEGEAALFLGEGSPMYDPVAYLSYPDRLLFVAAYTEEAYRRGRAALASAAELPAEPPVRTTLAMEAAAREIVGYEDELYALQELFEETEPDAAGGAEGNGGSAGAGEEELEEPDESLPTAEELQAVFSRLSENHNEGREESDEEVAAACGVEPDIVGPIREKLAGMFGGAGPGSAGAAGGTPQAADRFGLSPNAFRKLTSGGVPDVPGVLRLRGPEEITRYCREQAIDPETVVEAAPVLRFARWFLRKAVGDGAVPATQAGYVATKVVREAAENGIIPTPEEAFSARFAGGEVDEVTYEAVAERFRPKKESDWAMFEYFRTLLEHTGLIRFDGKRFLAHAARRSAAGVAADTAAADLLDSPLVLYCYLLEHTLTSYPWDDDSYLPPIPSLRESAGFLFYAAGAVAAEESGSGHGWAPVKRLTERFIAAAPQVAAAIASAEESEFADEEPAFSMADFVDAAVSAHFCYHLAESFGLFECRAVRAAGAAAEDEGRDQFRSTVLYEAVFERGTT